jgi:hypothetical protein
MTNKQFIIQFNIAIMRFKTLFYINQYMVYKSYFIAFQLTVKVKITVY